MPLSESDDLLSKILGGMLPSYVLNKVLEENPGLDKYDLANIFLGECELLDSKILPIVWNWKSVRSMRGVSDEVFDEMVLAHMRLAGYRL
ncbi:hypothetical protein [Pseudomonas sp. CCOS 191]|uniref:hypothetical protein n=1 Tax=Pseudomonas sp. CCOS 191 TaxID=1649877 RepID=UPI0009E3ACB5|nr:hypothetical protein [Pseudomonas sp. CCOS 191]